MSAILKSDIIDMTTGEKIPVQISVDEDGIFINVEGYGELHDDGDDGWPIGINIIDGKLQIRAWNNITSGVPVVIDMEGAKETKKPKLYFHEKGLLYE